MWMLNLKGISKAGAEVEQEIKDKIESFFATFEHDVRGTFAGDSVTGTIEHVVEAAGTAAVDAGVASVEGQPVVASLIGEFKEDGTTAHRTDDPNPPATPVPTENGVPTPVNGIGVEPGTAGPVPTTEPANPAEPAPETVTPVTSEPVPEGPVAP